MTGQLALGIMSGTSGDGVSLALAKFSGRDFKLLSYKTYPYSKSLSEKIVRPARLSLPGISALNFELGENFARAALKFLKETRVPPERVSVIGSHGQTLCHDPAGPMPSTLQIGESAVLAERTGIPVVSDFRTRDMAAGGEGAPLLPFFDQFYFGGGPARCLLNLGGIANVAVVGRNVKPLAFDTGPGNCLLDWAAAKISQGKAARDENGRMAARGSIWMGGVSQMMRHPYFVKAPPKSTGREVFNDKFVPARLKGLLQRNPEEALSTLTYLTAFSIREAHRRFIGPKVSLKEWIVSGGGVFNGTLLRHLRALLHPVPVLSIQDFGIHPQAKEPLAFAFFAWRALQGKINHLPEGTGAKGPRILGKITPGKNFRGIL